MDVQFHVQFACSAQNKPKLAKDKAKPASIGRIAGWVQESSQEP